MRTTHHTKTAIALFGGAILSAGVATDAKADIVYSNVNAEAIGGFDPTAIGDIASYIVNPMLPAPVAYSTTLGESEYWFNLDPNRMATAASFGAQGNGIINFTVDFTVDADTQATIRWALEDATAQSAGFTLRNMNTGGVVAGALTALGAPMTGERTVSLVAGTDYRLEFRTGDLGSNTAASFSFQIPAPPYAAAALFGLAAARRRR